MAEEEVRKQNKRKSTAKKSSKAKAKGSSRAKRSSTGKARTSSSSKAKSSTDKRTTRRKKTEELENQQTWELEQQPEAPAAPVEEPAAVDVYEEVPSDETPSVPAEEQAAPVEPEEPAAPSDDGTRVVSIEDYQPIIWASDIDNTDQNSETSSVNTESQQEISENSNPVSEEIRPADDSSEEPDRGFDSEKSHSDDFSEGTDTGFDHDAATPAAGGFDSKFTSSVKGGAASKIAGAAFVGVLVLMLILNIVTKDVLYSDQENRVFQQMPKFSVGNYLAGRFETQLDNYVSDQFAGRNAFIKIKSSADLTIGQIKANGVFKARDSYLMEDITWPDKASYTADVDALRKFKKKYPEKKMYFILVPNAANILADKLPAGVVTHDQNADMDRLLSSVKKIGYKPIDVRKELTEASKDQQVYYRTDHHWTTDGAYVAYKKAAKVMKLKSKTEYEPQVVKRDFVGTLYSKSGFTNGRKDAIKIYLPAGDKYLNSVIRYKDKKEKTTMYYDMANLDIKDAYTVFGGTNQSLITISTPTKENKHLLVVKDSYANCFIPFLTQDYRTITIVDPRYYYENIATVMKADEIDEVLFLYNANTFFSDNYMRMMLTNR